MAEMMVTLIHVFKKRITISDNGVKMFQITHDSYIKRNSIKSKGRRDRKISFLYFLYAHFVPVSESKAKSFIHQKVFSAIFTLIQFNQMNTLE